MMKIEIPKAKFHIGDEVEVRIEEAGLPPTFRARVCGIRLTASLDLDYTVMEDNGNQSDGYEENWMTAYKEPAMPEPVSALPPDHVVCSGCEDEMIYLRQHGRWALTLFASCPEQAQDFCKEHKDKSFPHVGGWEELFYPFQGAWTSKRSDDL